MNYPYIIHNRQGWAPFTEPEQPKPSCPITYRLKTEAEAGVESYALRNWGGRYGELSSDKYSFMVNAGVVITFDTENPADRFVVTETTHSFVANGCRRSYCKVCDANGVWDWQRGEFVPE